jgi:hypothetical protein
VSLEINVRLVGFNEIFVKYREVIGIGVVKSLRNYE